jgi:hypothetical protein
MLWTCDLLSIEVGTSSGAKAVNCGVRWLELTGAGNARGSLDCPAGFTSHFLLFSPVL